MQIKRLVIVCNFNKRTKDRMRQISSLYSCYNKVYKYGNKRQRKSLLRASLYTKSQHVFIGELRKFRGKYCWMLSPWGMSRHQNLDKIKNRLPLDIRNRYPIIYRDHAQIRSRNWNCVLVNKKHGISIMATHFTPLRQDDL